MILPYLVVAVAMVVGLLLSLLLSLRLKGALSIRLAGAIGACSIPIGCLLQALLEPREQINNPLPFLLMAIAYTALWELCTGCVQYRKRGQDPQLAPALIQELVQALILIAIIAVVSIIALPFLYAAR